MAASARLSEEGGRRRRAGALAAFAVVAGLAHLALLGGLRWTWNPPAAVGAAVSAPPLRVRSLPAPIGAVAVATPVAPPLAAPTPRAPRPPRAAPSPKRAAPSPTPATPASLAAAGADPVEGEPTPVYRTQPPPPITLRYDVRRGLADGTAELRWRRDPAGYALDGRIDIGDVAVLTQSSRGALDDAGLAPVRFLDQRPARAAAAVNFRRDLGRITFSRKAADAVLVAGAQDRLSWLVQLAAIVAAEPDLRREGSEVRMTVAGAGGEVADWRFRCQGEGTVETSAGPTPALRFVREPRGPYDVRAEVWLGWAAGHVLPLRAEWHSGPAGDGFELRLRESADPDAE